MTLEEAHREHLLALIESQAAAIKHARIALEDAERVLVQACSAHRRPGQRSMTSQPGLE